jgi:hypothetical protein
LRSLKLIHGQACILECLIGYFEQEALLRVHGFGLKSTHSKEIVIEETRILFKEMQPFRVKLTLESVSGKFTEGS